MLTGVCKLTVDEIILACRSFINFGNSRRVIYSYRHGIVGDTMFFVIATQSTNTSSLAIADRPRCRVD